ncbi:MAG: mechanosensitive ion channel family protein [Proteobacteria bacterium]|nr:mechanosensitive ion channel family protein [Pseudomonadota bacterium]
MINHYLEQIAATKELLWATKIFATILATLLVIFAINFVLRRLRNKVKASNSKLDDIFIKAARKPLKALIWILGIAYTIKLTESYSNFDLSDITLSLKNLGIVLCVFWFIWRLIREYENYLLKNQGTKIDDTTIHAIAKLLRTATIITALLMTLQTFGVSISGLLAFGGVGGVVIGFAAKDLLANFFGAMMIYLDRPFSVGDWIRSSDRNIEGTVEYIGWRLTHIRTFDKRMLYVPNSIFSTITVENPSRMSHRRISETIGVRYKDVNKIDNMLKEIKEMLINHKEIDESQTLMVNLNKFNDYSVDFFIYSFTHTTNWIKFHEIKQDILLEINNIISKNNAEIAFPTSIIEVESPISLAK